MSETLNEWMELVLQQSHPLLGLLYDIMGYGTSAVRVLLQM